MSTVVAILGTAALVVGIAMYDLVKSQRGGLKAGSVNLALQTISRNIVAALENDQAWLNTINANSINCLQTEGAVCAAGDFKDINVQLADGSLYVGTAANFGFNSAGQPCADFNATGSTRTDCIYRFTVRWDCADTPCQATHKEAPYPVAIQPRIRFTGTLQYAPYAPDDLNKSKRLSAEYYNFSVVRANLKDSLSESCQNFGGYFDQEAQLCRITKTSAQCPNGYYMDKLNSDGTPHCVTPPALLNSYCPPQNAVTGLGPDGGLRCFVF